MIGYHASHEQFDPAHLLALAARAAAAGFGGLSGSDHFHPWTPAQGQSGHAWSWAGAVLASVPLSLGLVTCPFGRYHPAVIAQAAATLARMYPERFWLAVGSGEALNEHVTGEPWPDKPARNARLHASAEAMRRLWRGERVDCDGEIRIREARLYTLPPRPPLLLGAALGAETARWLGGWADGLITVSAPLPKLREIVAAFREGGGIGKPMFLQVKLCYAATDAQARAEALAQWRANLAPPAIAADLVRPEDFAALADRLDPAGIEQAVNISSDPLRHAEWLSTYRELGFERLYLHNVGRQQEAFIDVFGAQVLPSLAGAWSRRYQP
ncbi:TIGR03885 family FMN-dependent LLM class oxidoreductase [[Pseudomonas] boreopolis]